MTPGEQLTKITSTALPTIVNPSLRHCERKVWASEVRKLLRKLGIEGVSVTAPNHSMASTIDIRLPQISHDHSEIDAYERAHPEVGYRPYGQTCPHCQARQVAHERLTAIILAAFPDLNDRSDRVSDYSDYCLSMN